ncbi:MAG TPA: hypothetical protein VFZ16_17155 [Hyphomicrobiaceae bacterium]|nr:hypothetical protein [Hyphomicrobiaceae bacterium]
MSMARLIVALATLMVLAGLISWQVQRDRLVQACVDAGGVWDGPHSRCHPIPRPILQREDYHRS